MSEPVAVRYAWADNPVCNLYSAEGLPLTPFRTDDWPGVTIHNSDSAIWTSQSKASSRRDCHRSVRCNAALAAGTFWESGADLRIMAAVLNLG